MINRTQRLTTRKWRGSNRSPPIGPFASISGGFEEPAAARSRTPGCYLRRAFDCCSKQSGRGRSNASAAADAALHWQRRGSEGERDKEGEICAEATAASKQKRQKETRRGFLPDYQGAIFSVSARPSAIRHHSSKITRSNRREKLRLFFFPPRVRRRIGRKWALRNGQRGVWRHGVYTHTHTHTID